MPVIKYFHDDNGYFVYCLLSNRISFSCSSEGTDLNKLRDCIIRILEQHSNYSSTRENFVMEIANTNSIDDYIDNPCNILIEDNEFRTKPI